MGRFIVGGGGTGGTVQPPLSFGVGLTQSGLIVDLDPAREAPGEIGGFNEAPADGLLYARVNNAGVAEWSPVTPGGLPFMGANPPPPVPPATQVIAGTLWWRTTNGSLYVYFFDGLNYQWVTASPTGEVVGAPLIFPPAPVNGAVMTATNNVTYVFDGLAWNAQDIGGGPVHIGPLPPALVPPATTYEPGTLWWRNDPDGELFIWYADGSSSQWVPASTNPPPTIHIGPLPPVAFSVGSLWWRNDPDGALFVYYNDGTSSQWVPATPASTQTVNPAGNTPSLIGSVWVPPRSATQGLELLDGYLTAPLASVDMPGVITEPEVGDVEHVRVRDIATGLGKWVTATTGGGIGDVPVSPVQAWARANGRWVDVPMPNAGRGLTADENGIHLDVATATELGGVFVPFAQGLELTPVGGLSLAPATPEIIGGLLDAPRDDTGLKQYARRWGQWVEVEASGVSIATATTLGVVFVPFNEGLELTLSGGLSLARATPEIIGGLLDAPRDDTGLKTYMRKWGEWVEAEASGVNIATATTLGVVFVPFNQGMELTLAGELSLARATPDVIGGLLDAPRDDTGLKTYTRKWGEWVEAGDVAIATATTLGVVFVPFNEGLELTLSGGLSLARATPEIIGGLVDAPRDDTGLKAYARKWGEWVETVAGFEDAPADGLAYWRRGTPGSVCEWESGSLYVDNNFLPLRGGILTGRLTLPLLLPNPIQPGPPLPYPERDDDAVHKRYVDERITPGVFTGIDPPPDPKDGQLWWDESSAGLYLYYDDPTSSQWVQVNSIAGLSVTDIVTDAPADNAVYGRYNQQWEHVDVYGDMKFGFQGSDHRGWVKLDGRAVAALTATQRNQATALGWTTNIPNATGVVPMQTGGVPGTINGTMLKTLTQANLPVVDLAAGSAGAHLHTAASAGGHQHRGYGGITGSALQFEDMGGTGAWENWGGYAVIGDTGNSYATYQTLVETNGAHEHTTDSTGAHVHTVPLGGSATPIDITPMSMAANAFVFLGY